MRIWHRSLKYVKDFRSFGSTCSPQHYRDKVLLNKSIEFTIAVRYNTHRIKAAALTSRRGFVLYGGIDIDVIEHFLHAIDKLGLFI